MNCHSPPGRSHLTDRLPPTYPPTTSPPPPQPQRDFTFHTLLSLPPLHLTPSLPPLTVVHQPCPHYSPPARLLVGHPLRARAATIPLYWSRHQAPATILGFPPSHPGPTLEGPPTHPPTHRLPHPPAGFCPAPGCHLPLKPGLGNPPGPTLKPDYSLFILSTLYQIWSPNQIRCNGKWVMIMIL